MAARCSISIKQEPGDARFSISPGYSKCEEELVTADRPVAEAAVTASESICIKTEPYDTSYCILPEEGPVTRGAYCIKEDVQGSFATSNPGSVGGSVKRETFPTEDSDLSALMPHSSTTRLVAEQYKMWEEKSASCSPHAANHEKRSPEPARDRPLDVPERELQSFASCGDRAQNMHVVIVALDPSGELETGRSTPVGETRCTVDQFPAALTRPVDLEADVQAHGTKMQHKCEFCLATFTSLSRFKAHTVMHTGETPYRCKLCPASFAWHAALRVHKKTHVKQKPHKCEHCCMTFVRPETLERHLRIHAEAKPYCCRICHAEFSLLPDLTSHFAEHEREMPNTCDLCPAEEFAEPADLRRHHQQAHAKPKPYCCKLCPAEFSRVKDFESHVAAAHPGQKPHPCKLCHAGFTKLRGLRRHQRIHTGAMPYACELCPAKFNLSKSLKNHSLIHTGGRPHKCELCLATFHTASGREYHVQVHHNP